MELTKLHELLSEKIRQPIKLPIEVRITSVEVKDDFVVLQARIADGSAAGNFDNPEPDDDGAPRYLLHEICLNPLGFETVDQVVELVVGSATNDVVALAVERDQELKKKDAG